MKLFIQIEDYFEGITSNISYSDRNKIRELRDNLNSCETVGTQIDFILKWREYKHNRNLDYRCFGISPNARLDEDLEQMKEQHKNTRNLNWNGRKNPDIEYLEQEWKSSGSNKLNNNINFIKSNYLAILKVSFWALLVFLVLNALIYLLGVSNSIGPTPFDFCADGRPISRTIRGYSKIKDGYKIPVDYVVAGKGYTGQDFEGPDNERGIGVFASEDFAWDGTDEFSLNNYAVAARWEYVQYSVKENKWPDHSAYGNLTTDGVDTTKPYTNLDSKQYSWTIKQKVLIHNPENNKAVVAIVGNGVDDANWGGSPLNSIAGLSYKAQEALGFKVAGLDGGDYDVNSRDSGVKLEMYWAPEDAEVGPVTGGLDVGFISSNCDPRYLISGGNSSVADAAVSYAYETQNEGRNNDGTPLYRFLVRSIFPGDSYYQSCDRGVATAIRWSGADDNYPAGNTETQYNYLSNSSKWAQITSFNGYNTDVLEPGDVLVTVGRGHTMVYVGNEAVRKKFPNSSGDLVSASIGERSPGIGNVVATLKYDRRPYVAFRNIERETDSKYKDINFN